jgi:uncharacterized glyoxalase superfamily protein PhnB
MPTSDTPTDRLSPTVFPAMKVRDGHAAIEWLETAFGFERRAVHEAADGTVAHAELAFGDDGMIMLGGESRTPDPENPWATARLGLYVHVDDVDAHYERARAAGAAIVRELADTPYGAREYSCRDPDGHLWSFGTYHPKKG